MTVDIQISSRIQTQRQMGRHDWKHYLSACADDKELTKGLVTQFLLSAAVPSCSCATKIVPRVKSSQQPQLWDTLGNGIHCVGFWNKQLFSSPKYPITLRHRYNLAFFWIHLRCSHLQCRLQVAYMYWST